MNFSAVGIANSALMRIGARGTIMSFTEDSPNAIKVNTVWPQIFSEVLSERDWKFAKTKVALQQSTLQPAYGYYYAYALPSDFLRLCKPKEIPQERPIVVADQYRWEGGYNGGGYNVFGRAHQSDVPVWPREVAPYIMETIPNTSNPQNIVYQMYLLTNYSAQVVPVSITYIRLITDLTQCTPGFVNALAYRLAAELAIAITEDQKKAEAMMQAYLGAVNGAQAQLECDDSLQDEAGSTTWVRAGRHIRWY